MALGGDYSEVSARAEVRARGKDFDGANSIQTRSGRQHRRAKGDDVEVVSGNIRGSSGKILAVFPQKQRVLVEGVRIIKKHLRKAQDNPSGKLAEREGPIHISNVRLIERDGKPVKAAESTAKKEKKKTYARLIMDNEFYRDYRERVMPALEKAHGYQNVLQIPKVEKVVINTSVGSQSDVKQALEEAKAELALITGQRPVETLAKKSISNFKLRKSQSIG